MITTVPKKLIVGPSARLSTVRALTRNYNRAIRAEEQAETLQSSWKLAAVSDRALRSLRSAQAGEVGKPAPRTMRNLAKAGMATLAMFGRAVAKAMTAKAGLAKARAANAARVVARKVRKSMRAAVRLVVAIAIRPIAKLATVSIPVALIVMSMVAGCTCTDDRMSIAEYETHLQRVDGVACLIPYSLGTELLAVRPNTAEPDPLGTWVYPAFAFDGLQTGEAVYRRADMTIATEVYNGDTDAAAIDVRAEWVPCIANRVQR